MFSQVIGHERIIEMLRVQVKNDRIAGAYLFAGPEHVGKRTTALAFAKAANCRETDDDACGKCISCKKIDGGNHPDVHVIEPSGSWLKIQQIREMQRNASFRAMEGRYKFFIVLHADRMTSEAANSLLKTLEEPPQNTVIVLIATNMSMILPTIISRCQIFRFHDIPRETLVKMIESRFLLNRTTAARIVLLSGGKVGKALEMAEDPDVIEGETIPPLLRGIEYIEVFKAAEELASNPGKLSELLSWYRDLMLVKDGVPADGIVHSDSWDRLREIGRNITRRQALEAVHLIIDTYDLVQHNINAMLAMENLCLRLREMVNGRIERTFG